MAEEMHANYRFNDLIQKKGKTLSPLHLIETVYIFFPKSPEIENSEDLLSKDRGLRERKCSLLLMAKFKGAHMFV